MGGSPSCQIAAVDMKGPEALMVKEKVENNCVVIFSKTYCPYCKMAKKVFQDLGVSYQVYELDKQQGGMAVQDVLDGMTGARTILLDHVQEVLNWVEDRAVTWSNLYEGYHAVIKPLSDRFGSVSRSTVLLKHTGTCEVERI
ncbi:Glutaredoxin-2, mitochondrial [Chionoecetes opilio]|uniref:Glutaredoxin-2, mitochondrial n=1 Tax=Chionoecetes opilio TaxID=41210 RepID=A0A8J5CL22_CHIOP|nr:Glutaredoxin-2, mitochondrial [Chionoecetes opilio]